MRFDKKGSSKKPMKTQEDTFTTEIFFRGLADQH